MPGNKTGAKLGGRDDCFVLDAAYNFVKEFLAIYGFGPELVRGSKGGLRFGFGMAEGTPSITNGWATIHLNGGVHSSW